MQTKARINAVEVIINQDLTVSYRLTLPVKAEHTELLDRTKIHSFIRKNKIVYMFVVESDNRLEIIKQQTAAQTLINEQKIKELISKQGYLLNKLSNL